MQKCIFCSMVSGQIKVDKVYEDELLLAFRDVNPQAPTHVLIIPKEHIATLNDLTPAHTLLAGQMILAAQRIAGQEGIAEQGYRTVFNCNAHAGQSVFHVHLHLLGGRYMEWPPG